MAPIAGKGSITEDDRWQMWEADPSAVPQATRTALVSAESALADGAAEPGRWSALSAAVTAERGLDHGSAPQRRFRYLIGRLIRSLLDSTQHLQPHDILGAWVADLILALANDSALPPPPAPTC